MNSPLLSDDERARIVEEMQAGIGALVAALPDAQRALPRALVEAAVAVVLWGSEEVPAELATQVHRWWREHTQSTDRELALRVWHAVSAASADAAAHIDSHVPAKHAHGARAKDVFQTAVQDLKDPNRNLTAGTRPVVLGRTRLIRLYYAERRRRAAAGDASVPPQD